MAPVYRLLVEVRNINVGMIPNLFFAAPYHQQPILSLDLRVALHKLRLRHPQGRTSGSSSESETLVTSRRSRNIICQYA